MKLRELLKKTFLRRSHAGEGERSSNSVDEAFTVSSGEAPASWIPSQQDRPRH